MGLEEMYANPIGLAKKDKGLFDFIFNNRAAMNRLRLQHPHGRPPFEAAGFGVGGDAV